MKEVAAGSAVAFEPAPEESLPQIVEEEAVVAVVQSKEMEHALRKLGVIEVILWREEGLPFNCFVSKCKKRFGLLQGCRYCKLCFDNADALEWNTNSWDWDDSDLEMLDPQEVCKEGCEEPCEVCNLLVINSTYRFCTYSS